jgi:gliding motility associated protien GldN
MKKICIIAIALLSVIVMQAQHELPNSYFNEMGLIRLETQELSDASDTLVSIYHRSDDVVWSRIVYRIIDMRYKQNYQLYTPLTSENPHYSSLFLVMLKAMEKGLRVYEKSPEPGDVKPYFNEGPMAKDAVARLLNTDRTGELSDGNIATSDYVLLHYDAATDSLKFNPYPYKGFVKNQLKYMIQEIIFFDKHYSRLYTKILAIAPLHADNVTYFEGMPVMDALYGQILFWVPFDSFRPFMARQYMLPHGDNDAKRVTYDEFFQKKLYSSYIVGLSNVYDRMIPQLATTHEEVKKWQEKIEWELLTVEQDLWEY